MEQELPKFQQAHADVVAVAVQRQAGAQSTVAQTSVTFPILADPDHKISEAYGVYNLLQDNVAAPAVFIINPAGQIVWSYIGKNFDDRPAIDTILANIPPPPM